jgi:hypothetical protein
MTTGRQVGGRPWIMSKTGAGWRFKGALLMAAALLDRHGEGRTTEKLESAIYEAFLAAGKQLGAKSRGLSCLVRNWKALSKASDADNSFQSFRR